MDVRLRLLQHLDVRVGMAKDRQSQQTERLPVPLRSSLSVTVSFEGVQEAARSAGIDPPSDVPMALKLLARLLRRDIPAETARLDQLTERVRAVFDEYSAGMPQKRARTN